LRTEAGFPSAYAFYHRNGGRRVFPFTYSFYLKLEKGRALPRPPWLARIVSALRLPPDDASLRALIHDYLQDLVSDRMFFDVFVRPMLRVEGAPPAPVAKAVRRLISEQAYHLTPAQFAAVASSPNTHWVFECLVNSRKPQTVERLAEVLRVTEEAVRAAIHLLDKAGLAKRIGRNRVSCPIACRFYVFPKEYPGFDEDRARLVSACESQAAKRGRDLFNAGIMIRAEEGDAKRGLEGLQRAMEAASAYSVYDDGRDSAFFLFETRVRRILPF